MVFFGLGTYGRESYSRGVLYSTDMVVDRAACMQSLAMAGVGRTRGRGGGQGGEEQEEGEEEERWRWM